MPGVLDWKDRLKNIEYALSLDLPRLTMRPERKDSLTLACYGPSLRKTWLDISGALLSVSGAHDWLIERRREPSFHLEADPRPHKAGMLTKARKGTQYLLASCCHPDVFKALEGQDIYLWHLSNGAESDAWHQQHTPGEIIAPGGSTAGLRALEIAHVLGFRSLEIHGMDSSFHQGQWAGPHTGKQKTDFMVRCNGKHFSTSSLMVQQAREFVHFWQTHDVKVRMKGDGLIREMMKEAQQNRRAA